MQGEPYTIKDVISSMKDQQDKTEKQITSLIKVSGDISTNVAILKETTAFLQKDLDSTNSKIDAKINEHVLKCKKSNPDTGITRARDFTTEHPFITTGSFTALILTVIEILRGGYL